MNTSCDSHTNKQLNYNHTAQKVRSGNTNTTLKSLLNSASSTNTLVVSTCQLTNNQLQQHDHLFYVEVGP